MDFIVDGESSTDYFGSGGANSEVWWQSEQMQHGNDTVPEDSENVPDELQWQLIKKCRMIPLQNSQELVSPHHNRNTLGVRCSHHHQ